GNGEERAGRNGVEREGHDLIERQLVGGDRLLPSVHDDRELVRLVAVIVVLLGHGRHPLSSPRKSILDRNWDGRTPGYPAPAVSEAERSAPSSHCTDRGRCSRSAPPKRSAPRSVWPL